MRNKLVPRMINPASIFDQSSSEFRNFVARFFQRFKAVLYMLHGKIAIAPIVSTFGQAPYLNHMIFLRNHTVVVEKPCCAFPENLINFISLIE
ncbi:hypothetical protein ATO10_06816 [Actibacterium atlanticum]|uniref:Uncharacterized protein n=1 Tax=Actibacterium atlanticum TaxID=1461693 RepID=A0A058ZLY0_9RHOB|nr:hypothetical protein ATO10_06816 [Actibacterium atlanticum]